MREIVFIVFIAGAIPFIVMRPYIGLLVWSWLSYMNPYRFTYGFAYSFPWVELIAIVTLGSFIFSKESKKLPWSVTSVLMLVFLLWTGLTTVFAVMPHPAWLKWQEFAKEMIMVFMTFILVNNRTRMRWLVWMIVVSLGFFGIKGGLFTLSRGGVSHVFGPPGSFIADNNALALALCLTLPLMRYLQLSSSHRLVRIGLGIGMLLTGIAVLGTYSRGGLIGLVIVAGALFLRSRRRLMVAAVAVVVGFAAFHFMPAQWVARMDTLHYASTTDSGETRIQSWEFAANVALHRPLTGGGFEVYQSDAMWRAYGPEGAIPRAIHSIYFRTLGEQGFIGLGLFLALLLVSWRNCGKVRKRTRRIPDMQWAHDLASMLEVSLLAYLVAGAFLPIPYFGVAYQLMALSAILAGYCVQDIAGQQFAEIRGPVAATGTKWSSVNTLRDL